MSEKPFNIHRLVLEDNATDQKQFSNPYPSSNQKKAKIIERVFGS